MSMTSHPDAFCLMIYQDEITGEREVIWNSRDGVTPFTITSRAGNPSRHIGWRRASRVPDHVPHLGERVFVDLTLERARAYRQTFVAKWWDRQTIGGRMSQHWETPEAAVEALAQGDVETPGQPDLIEVDQAFLAFLHARRRQPGEVRTHA